jgi:hypothetical protein
VARRAAWAGLVLIAAAAVFALRPVCVPLTPDQLAGFTSPIESRTDRDFYLQLFQQIDGRWHQCKTWLSRQLFF